MYAYVVANQSCHSNAFIVPVVYFFYPETAYRSLEEMDSIFRKTTNIFSVVRIAREHPRRFGKNGEVLITYDQTEEHQRRVSAVGGAAGKDNVYTAENKDHSNPDYFAENGNSTISK